MWEDDHEHHERDDEDRHQDDGDAIEIFLDDAGTLIRSINTRCDHVGNTSSLAGMQQDEDDETDTRKNEQN